MADRAGRYQICGPNAFNRYGYDGQIPNRIYTYNNRISGDRAIATVNLTLIKVADERLGETDAQKTVDGETAVYSSRARTRFDAVYDWSRFGSLPRAYGWIRADLGAKRVLPADLVRITLRFGDVGAIRRIGALLDREGVNERHMRRLEQELRTPTNPIPWIPGRARRGTVDRRWGIVWNDRLTLTAARTGFQVRLVEKDYFYSVLLQYLASTVRGRWCSTTASSTASSGPACPLSGAPGVRALQGAGDGAERPGLRGAPRQHRGHPQDAPGEA
ncbi:MAG TPA: hypothetical protein VGK32_15435 [Vicinamibacterales bacterium]|jgi:hypothetical protein